MIKRLGIIFAGLLIVLLLSNINHNANIQVLAQQNTSTITTNASVPIAPSDTVSNITKLTGGVKIISPDKGDLVPLNSNNSLVIQGVSKDNATSDCDVSIIINNVKPYQTVKPAGIQGDNDYSNWQYTVSSNYTTINEGNNKITSKILCLDGPQKLQAYYSVNVTATNFTQPQLSSYNMMLESSNSTTNSSGNMSQASSSGLQPFAQIQQFNQDTGNGPICCKIAGSSPGQVSASTAGTDIPITNDVATDVATTSNDEEIEEEDSNNDDSNNDDSNNDDSNNDDSNNDDSNNDDNDGDGGGSIMDSVEDTLRDSGIDFSFD